MVLPLLFMALFLIITIPSKYAIASTPAVKKTVLILGDSLSAGYGIEHGKNWTDLLQNRFNHHNKEVQIVNASISGDTTANGLNRLSNALEQFEPQLLLVELGGNDGLRGLPIGHIKNNLDAIIQTGMAKNIKVILMAIAIPPNYGKRYTEAFSQIYPQLAQQYALPMIPFILRDIAVNPELMQNDGIHPNEQAQPRIMEQLWQVLLPLLKEPHEKL